MYCIARLDKVLSEALKEFVTDSLVERTVYSEIPPKVCYKIRNIE
ncbi:winged helix-turn-helix transcriptional regulator [Paenibacillus peoriae]